MTDVTDVSTEPETTTDVAVPEEAAAPAEVVPFWRRPRVERYLMPLIVPIAVVLGIVIYVLNISRVFLSAHGHIPVVICSFVLLAILFGATLLANASLKTTSIALATAGFLFVVFLSGWLVLGSSQVKSNGSATLPLVGPYSETFQITASPTGGLSFGPSSLSTKTGLALITFVDGANAQHTLNFQETNTLWPGLVVNKQGEKLEGRIFFPSAGDYTYYCAVPGHEAAGMHGIVHVTGPTVTLQQAEAAAGKAPGKTPAGSSGASGASG